MKHFFRIGGSISKRESMMIEIGGAIFFIIVWFILTYPIDSTMIKFNCKDAKYPVKYTWTKPDNSKTEFSGDDIIFKASAGKYDFSFIDSAGCKISGNITVPEKISEKNITEYKDSCKTKNMQIIVEVENFQDGWLISKAVIPSPLKVLYSFKDLHFNDLIVREAGFSIFLNVLGYIEAIVLSILLGFIIGLIPFFRSLLNRFVNAIRFVPITAVTGLFIFWFGIFINMKVQFLAFGIFVYLLPVVVQRLDEIEKVYLQTAYTLGATKWQMIRDIYWPYVSSKIIDDIRVLTAISWTYIIVAELANNTGGLGSLIYKAQKFDRYDKVFALLFIIIIIGILQDKLFQWIDKRLFKYKYQVK